MEQELALVLALVLASEQSLAPAQGPHQVRVLAPRRAQGPEQTQVREQVSIPAPVQSQAREQVPLPAQVRFQVQDRVPSRTEHPALAHWRAQALAPLAARA